MRIAISLTACFVDIMLYRQKRSRNFYTLTLLGLIRDVVMSVAAVSVLMAIGLRLNTLFIFDTSKGLYTRRTARRMAPDMYTIAFVVSAVLSCLSFFITFTK